MKALQRVLILGTGPAAVQFQVAKQLNAVLWRVSLLEKSSQR
jgi:hypothetical protein